MECLEKNEIVQKKKPWATDLLARFPEESGDPILRIDDEGILFYINPVAKSLLNEWKPCVGSPLPETFLASLNRCLDSGTCAQTGVEVKVEDRRLVFRPIRLADSNFLFLYGHDVTWWRHYEDHLKLLANVFENVGESIIVTDAHGVIEAVNPAFTAINGYTAEEVIGKTPACLKSNRHSADFYKWMWHELAKKGSWKGKIWNRRKSGEVYPALLSISAIRDEHGKTTHYCSIGYDITGRWEEKEKVSFAAYHDPLTGLPNMHLFYDRLDRAFQRARQDRSPIGILVVNLDGFRRFNARFGHHLGDRLLQQVARRLRWACRDDETLTRASADEFIMIVRSDGRDAATLAQRADQIMKSFSVPVTLEKASVQVAIRMGLAIYPQTATNMHTLLEQAQEAVHLAGKSGGGRYVVYTPTLHKKEGKGG